MPKYKINILEVVDYVQKKTLGNQKLYQKELYDFLSQTYGITQPRHCCMTLYKKKFLEKIILDRLTIFVVVHRNFKKNFERK